MTEGLPGFFQKRSILHEASSDERLDLAARFLAAGFPDDALDCLQAAGAMDQVAALAPAAVETGDPFLLIRIEKIRGAEIARETWDAAIDAAERSGKATLASLARRYLAPRLLS